MDEETNVGIIIALTIILVIGIIAFSIIIFQKNKIDNFQNTIKDLSPEEKCIYICGFEFNAQFDQYKFCLEKCDRISERSLN